ncbi:MAG: hypothetical protein HYU99_00895 [Deltaproteobacteria bacterium]|nr:hypothetical protein [Deltaproteobacteria bacterium]
MTLVIAHRGSRAHAPENTLLAFQKAHEQGADGIELDVHRTADGTVVVYHDDRISDAAERTLPIRATKWEILKKIVLPQNQTIPTLREVFEQFGQKFSVINVEIKSTGYFTNGIEKAVLDLVCRFHLEDRVIISSFNPLHLWRICRMNRRVRTGHLIWPPQWFARRHFWTRLCHVYSVNLEHEWAANGHLEEFAKLEKKIWIWTVNKENELRRWFTRGVDAIITDDPLRALKIRKQISASLPL